MGKNKKAKLYYFFNWSYLEKTRLEATRTSWGQLLEVNSGQGF